MLLTERAGWQTLTRLAEEMDNIHLSELLYDKNRQQSLAFDQLSNFYVDFSKQRLTTEILEELVALATEADLAGRIHAMLSGAIVNPSEQRPALHTALRALDANSSFLPDAQYNSDINEALDTMESIIQRLYSNEWLGFTGKPITDVVNIGVGGSDLGPLMAEFALKQFAVGRSIDIDIHFASSIDGSQLAALLDELNPERTLFCIVSKTFTTIDTLSNAETALAWLTSMSPDEAALKRHHFMGVSSYPAKMHEWGIAEANQLTFWDWVGGRYSMWSNVGFAIALRIGIDGFKQFLAGAHAVDKHFAQTPLSENIPVLMGLIDVWNCNFMQTNAHAILPYDGRLKHLPAYLGQLEMESNGKSVSLNEKNITYNTCPILWGEVGANAQHAFYQLLHQGTEQVNSDFIICKERHAGKTMAEKEAFEEQQELNIANCLAQSRVLALGSEAMTEEERNGSTAFQQYHGNQPSTTIVMDRLTPYNLGGLIALYEHKVFVSSVLWDINPFDQWGVELGKKMARQLQPVLNGQEEPTLDSSTAALVSVIRAK